MTQQFTEQDVANLRRMSEDQQLAARCFKGGTEQQKCLKDADLLARVAAFIATHVLEESP